MLVTFAHRHLSLATRIEAASVAVSASLLIAETCIIGVHKVADAGALPGAKKAFGHLFRLKCSSGSGAQGCVTRLASLNVASDPSASIPIVLKSVISLGNADLCVLHGLRHPSAAGLATSYDDICLASVLAVSVLEMVFASGGGGGWMASGGGGSSAASGGGGGSAASGRRGRPQRISSCGRPPPTERTPCGGLAETEEIALAVLKVDTGCVTVDNVFFRCDNSDQE